jgi:hypothetical protein
MVFPFCVVFFLYAAAAASLFRSTWCFSYRNTREPAASAISNRRMGVVVCRTVQIPMMIFREVNLLALGWLLKTVNSAGCGIYSTTPRASNCSRPACLFFCVDQDLFFSRSGFCGAFHFHLNNWIFVVFF